jgi:Mn2+/Fe2+ NRAMP family transporter
MTILAGSRNGPRRLALIGVVVLVAGLAGAAWVLNKERTYDGRKDAASIHLIGQSEYGLAPGDSKLYISNLEIVGGHAAVIMDGFNRWLGDLWHRRQVAYTVAALAAAIAIACFVTAYRQSRRL